MTFRFVAIDPGDRHVGIAQFTVQPGPPRPALANVWDAADDGRVNLVECLTLDPASAISYLETRVRTFHAVVLEAFRLYPWLAREQGFSDFPTAQLVGVIKYLAAHVDRPVYLQDAKDNLKEGRRQAKLHGFKMTERQLGHGKYAYRGPDFDYPGPPHRRDAAAHGCRWVYCDPNSPLV